MTVRIEDNDLEELLLQRYCSDTASAEEAPRIEAWFREHHDQRVWYEQFKTALRKQDYPLVSEEYLDAKLAEFLRAALQRHPAAPHNKGVFSGQPLRWFLSTVLNRLAGSAIAALFGRHVTTLTTAEITELQGLVEHAAPEDE